MQPMDSIEQKEIRGLSVKGMITIITSTVLMCATVVGTYSALKSDIKELILMRSNDKEVLNMRLQNIEANSNANTALYKALELQVQELQRNQKK